MTFSGLWVGTLNSQITFQPPAATGGTETTSGSYKIHTFTTTGDLIFSSGGTVEYLVLAGGGGGSSPNNVGTDGNSGVNIGMGGPGGLIKTGTVVVNAQTYTITVGAGGASGLSGSTPGGVPNGGAGSPSSFGALVSSNGGTITGDYGTNNPGGDANPGSNGMASSISGTSIIYGGGGGGGGVAYGSIIQYGGAGGLSYGAVGGAARSGSTNAARWGGAGGNGLQPGGGGGGGGGAPNYNRYGPGGTGGAGIVIVRYLI